MPWGIQLDEECKPSEGEIGERVQGDWRPQASSGPFHHTAEHQARGEGGDARQRSENHHVAQSEEGRSHNIFRREPPPAPNSQPDPEPSLLQQAAKEEFFEEGERRKEKKAI